MTVSSSVFTALPVSTQPLVLRAREKNVVPPLLSSSLTGVQNSGFTKPATLGLMQISGAFTVGTLSNSALGYVPCQGVQIKYSVCFIQLYF